MLAERQTVGITLELRVKLHAAVRHGDSEDLIAAVLRRLTVYMVFPAGEVPAFGGLGREGQCRAGSIRIAVLKIGAVRLDRVFHRRAAHGGRRRKRRNGQGVLLGAEGNDRMSACCGLHDRQGGLSGAVCNSLAVQRPACYLVAVIRCGAEDHGLTDRRLCCACRTGNRNRAVVALSLCDCRADRIGIAGDDQLGGGQCVIVVLRNAVDRSVTQRNRDGVYARFGSIRSIVACGVGGNDRKHGRLIPIADQSLHFQRRPDVVIQGASLVWRIDLACRNRPVRQSGDLCVLALHGNTSHPAHAVFLQHHGFRCPSGAVILKALFMSECKDRACNKVARELPVLRIIAFLTLGNAAVCVHRVLDEAQRIAVGVGAVCVYKFRVRLDALGVELRRFRLIGRGQEHLAAAVIRRDLVYAVCRTDRHGRRALGVKIRGVNRFRAARAELEADRTGRNGVHAHALDRGGELAGIPVDRQVCDFRLTLRVGHRDLGRVRRYEVLVRQCADLAAVNALCVRVRIPEGQGIPGFTGNVRPAALGVLLLPLVEDLRAGKLALVRDVRGGPDDRIRAGIQRFAADRHLRHAAVRLGVGGVGSAGDTGVGLRGADGLDAVFILRVRAESGIRVGVVPAGAGGCALACLDRADLIVAGRGRRLEVAVEHKACRIAAVIPFESDPVGGGLLLVRAEVLRQQRRLLHARDQIGDDGVLALIQEAHQFPVEVVAVLVRL